MPRVARSPDRSKVVELGNRRRRIEEAAYWRGFGDAISFVEDRTREAMELSPADLDRFLDLNGDEPGAGLPPSVVELLLGGAWR